MGTMQRNKGRRAEQLIVNRLKDAGFESAARNLNQTRESGYDITGLEPFAIEIKDHKKLCVPQWWQQTTDNAAGDLIPCLIYHIPHTSHWRVQLPMSVLNPELCSSKTVTVDFEDFVYVAREIVA